jgi:hypothetical protein
MEAIINSENISYFVFVWGLSMFLVIAFLRRLIKSLKKTKE